MIFIESEAMPEDTILLIPRGQPPANLTEAEQWEWLIKRTVLIKNVKVERLSRASD